MPRFRPERARMVLLTLRARRAMGRRGPLPEEVTGEPVSPRRRASARKGWATRRANYTPEEMGARIRAGMPELTPEKLAARSEKIREGWARHTPEKRVDIVAKALATKARQRPGEHAARIRATWEGLTPEQRAARTEKARAARRKQKDRT